MAGLFEFIGIDNPIISKAVAIAMPIKLNLLISLFMVIDCVKIEFSFFLLLIVI